jgi:hypothetical protein
MGLFVFHGRLGLEDRDARSVTTAFFNSLLPQDVGGLELPLPVLRVLRLPQAHYVAKVAVRVESLLHGWTSTAIMYQSAPASGDATAYKRDDPMQTRNAILVKKLLVVRVPAIVGRALECVVKLARLKDHTLPVMGQKSCARV